MGSISVDIENCAVAADLTEVKYDFPNSTYYKIYPAINNKFMDLGA